jgi:hypothetical protein
LHERIMPVMTICSAKECTDSIFYIDSRGC